MPPISSVCSRRTGESTPSAHSDPCPPPPRSTIAAETDVHRSAQSRRKISLQPKSLHPRLLLGKPDPAQRKGRRLAPSPPGLARRLPTRQSRLVIPSGG